MIKGVNRQVVEVNDTGCEYFERIMFFVKPEYSGISEGKIRERAGMIAASTKGVPPTKIKRNRFLEIGKLVVSAIVGAALAVVFFNFIV